MKRKLLLPILSVCMVVALVSVGFAAWLITGADTSDDAQGQFVTYGVDNEYFTVTINPTAVKDTKIFFGKTNTQAADNAWFQWTDVEQESLSKEFTVTVTFDDLSEKKDNEILAILNKWDITLNMITADAESGDKKEAYKTATSEKYIAEPKFYVNNATTAASVEGNTILGTLRPSDATFGETGGMKLTITGWKGTGASGKIATDSSNKKFVQATVKVEFGWGEYFKVGSKNVNPESYFLGGNFANGTSKNFDKGNSSYTALDNDSKKALRDEAQKVMSAINNLSEQQFTIYLGATVKPGS